LWKVHSDGFTNFTPNLLQGSPSAALSEMMAANVRQKKDDRTTWSAAAVAVLGAFILIQ
jgi:hypothetical protein